MDTALVSLYEGKSWHVVALKITGQCPTHDYLEHAEKRNRKDRDRLVSRIQRVADMAHFRNTEVFNNEGDGIYAFKTREGLRLYAFFDAGHLIVTVSGSDKPKKKQQQKDIAEAAKWRDRYLALKSKPIKIIYEQKT